jgi:hypothetical protein
VGRVALAELMDDHGGVGIRDGGPVVSPCLGAPEEDVRGRRALEHQRHPEFISHAGLERETLELVVEGRVDDRSLAKADRGPGLRGRSSTVSGRWG